MLRTGELVSSLHHWVIASCANTSVCNISISYYSDQYQLTSKKGHSKCCRTGLTALGRLGWAGRFAGLVGHKHAQRLSIVLQVTRKSTLPWLLTTSGRKSHSVHCQQDNPCGAGSRDRCPAKTHHPWDGRMDGMAQRDDRTESNENIRMDGFHCLLSLWSTQVLLSYKFLNYFSKFLSRLGWDNYQQLSARLPK